MTVFKTSKGWRGKLQLRNAAGRPKSKVFYGQSEQEVRDKIRLFQKTHVSECPEPDMTVAHMCELAVRRAIENGCRDNTIRGYRSFLRLHVGPSIGRKKVSELRAWDVEHMMADMDTSRQTKLLARAFLRMAINKVAIKARVVMFNVAEQADLPRMSRPAKVNQRLTPEALGKILAAEFNPVRRALYRCIASTGLRIGEARFLTWNEVKKREDGYWIELTNSKTDAGLQPIPMPAATWAELETLGKRSVCVFPSESGNPISESNLRRAWLATLKRAGLPSTNIYKLRALYATTKARTVNDITLKRLMRHTDIRTTKQYYASALDADLREAAES